MRKSIRRVGVLGALALVAGVLGPIAPAQAQAQTYQIQIAQFLEGAPAESMRFFPGTINVHKGDTLHFTSESFHSATFLPKGQHPITWAGSFGKFGDPFGLYTRDPDEGADAMKANNAVLFPTRQDCGQAGQPACAYDGSGDATGGVLNSGLPLGGPLDFSVTVTANPGDTLWVVCLVHTHMFMRVNVVADNTAATTQASIDEAKARLIAFDTDWAVSAHTRLNRPTSHETADGTKVWDVYVGYDNHWVSLFAMYPRRLRIPRGATVRYHFDGLIYETHTATLPVSIANGVGQQNFAPVCDTDGDQGTAPDSPPQIEGPPFCNDPRQLELDLSAEAMLPVGDGIYTGGDDFENSGERGPAAFTSNPPFVGNASFDVKFAKLSGDEPFKYMCLVHPFMKGRVAVKAPR